MKNVRSLEAVHTHTHTHTHNILKNYLNSSFIKYTKNRIDVKNRDRPY